MIKKSLLHLISQPFLSRLYGRLTRIRHPRILTRFIIRRFMNHYGIDMNSYLGQPEDYASLAEFFVRPLDPAQRPLVPDPAFILSPSDGRVADLQIINSDQAVQAKGMTYTVSQLIGENLDWSRNWWLCTIYLSPANYHRYHYPWSARLNLLRQLGTRLYPVNRHGVETIPGLFVRNERVVCRFGFQGESVFATAVGATFVGSIAMTAAPVPIQSAEERVLECDVRQMEEMGRFNLGSTLILLFPQSLANPVVEIQQKIAVGTPLFVLRSL